MRAAASSDQLPSSPPRRSRKGIAIVTVLVAVLAAVVTFCALRLRSTPSTVAVFPSRDESDGGSYYTAEGNLLCGIRLAADRTHAYVGDEDGSVTLTLHYVGKDDYVFAGTGVVHGRVLWQNVDNRGNAIAGEEPEPVASAHVRAYRLVNRKFVALDDNEAVSAADGTFTISELPMGNLVLLAEMDGKKSDPYQLYLVDDKWDGGDMHIKRHRPMVYVHVKDSSGKVVTDAKVTLAGDDGEVYVAAKEKSSADKAFVAGVTSQHYKVEVVPNDKRLSQASVELEVPDSEPWRHDITVTLGAIGELYGKVYDAQTSEPLPDVEVSWDGPSGLGFAQTDAAGDYKSGDVAAGEYTLTFKKAGYQTKTLTMTCSDEGTPVEDVYLEPEVVPEGAACSACIGAFDGTTYMIEPLAAGIELLSTPCARYDYICSFALHNGKIYYCCKEAGTALCQALCHMALYESDVDGSNARKLYTPDADVTSVAWLAVCDGMLYYREYLDGVVNPRH